MDWSSYTIEQEVNPMESVELVKCLPIYHFWDNSKKAFRTGLIGDRLLDTFPDLVSQIKRPTSASGKVFEESYAVDTNTIFTHTLSVLRYLFNVSVDISDNLSARYIPQQILQQQKDTMLKISGWDELRKKESDLKQKYELVIKQIEKMQHKRKIKEYGISYRQNKTKGLISASHHILFDRLVAHYNNISVINKEKFEKLEVIQNITAHKKYEIEKSVLEKQFIEDIKVLENEVELVRETAVFRLLEQQKAASELDSSSIRIMLAQSEASGKNVELMVSTVFQDIIYRFGTVLADPSNILRLGQFLFLILFVVVFTMEAYRVLHVFITKMFFDGLPIKKTKVSSEVKKKWDNNKLENNQLFRSSGIFLEQSLEDQLKSFLRTLVIAERNNLNLPNALFTGPAGVGKSLSIKRFTELSVLPCTILNSGDLEALGKGAGLFLREIADSCKNNKKKLILIIEDSDSLISSRANDKLINKEKENNFLYEVSEGNKSSVSVSNCLFSLLEAIRDNSKYLSIILTCRLAVNKVDIAILDRVDFVVNFKEPSEIALRLELSIHLLNVDLKSFVDSETQQLLEKLKNQDIISLKSTILKDEVIHVLTKGINGEVVQNKVENKIKSIEIVPETDCPVELNKNFNFENNSSKSKSRKVYEFIRNNLDGYKNDLFDLVVCLRGLLELSEKWTFRDLHKFIMSVKYDALSDERCKISNFAWMRELLLATEQQQQQLVAGV